MQQYKPRSSGAAGRASRQQQQTRIMQANAPRGSAAPASDRTQVRRAVPKTPPPGGPGGPRGPRGPRGRRNRKPPKGHVAKAFFKNLGKALLVLLCLGVIAGTVAGVSVVKYVVESTKDDDLLLNLDDLKLPQTGYILAKDPGSGEWVEYQKLVRDSNSIWVPLEQMPQGLKDAVVATEDREFYDHSGFSVSRTAYAALNEVFHFQGTFGASTIDQQLVKNLTGDKAVADSDGNMEAGYQRKLREIYRAWSLNKQYSKEMILEAYLNTLPLSGTIVGVQAGALEYFGKDISETSLPEQAMIAGITQYPSRYNPYKNPDACKERRDDVLTFMLRDEKITQEEYEQAINTPIELYDGPRQYDTSADETGVTSYFTDAVFEAVIHDMVEQGVAASREAAVAKYYSGGLRIECTIDLDLQAKLEEVYETGYDEEGLFPQLAITSEETGEEVLPQSAMAVVRYDGTLAGVVGGIGEKNESLGLNRATQSPRPVGSTMKPLAAYALGIDYGIVNYSSLVADTYVDPEKKWPVNYGPSNPTEEQVSVADALAQSLNTVPAHIGDWVGTDQMFDFLQNTLEISTLVDEGAANDHGLSPLVLGGMTRGVSAAELACAYTMFGGENAENSTNGYGVFNSLHCYTQVLDSRGNVILKPEVASVQAVSPETGYVMNRLLSNVLRTSGPVAGTARGLALETSDSVGKTGTTSDDKDRWFVGLTPQYVSAVWWGYDTNEALKWSASAATNPPPNVWKTIMDAVQEGTENTDFPAAPERVKEHTYCRDTGLLVGEHCENRQAGYFDSENLPETCTGHAPEPAPTPQTITPSPETKNKNADKITEKKPESQKEEEPVSSTPEEPVVSTPAPEPEPEPEPEAPPVDSTPPATEDPPSTPEEMLPPGGEEEGG